MNTANAFAAPLKAALRDERLFNAVLERARLFKQSPDNMHQRGLLKRWCVDMNLPEPSFPAAQADEFISLHEAMQMPSFIEWLRSRQIKWHEHLGLNQFHWHCCCRMDKKELICVGIDISHDVFFKMVIDSIKYRGQLFAWNKKVQKCLPSKISINNGKFRLTQTLKINTYITMDTGVAARQDVQC